MWVSDDSIIEYGAIMSMQSNAPIQGVSYLYQKPNMPAYTRALSMSSMLSSMRPMIPSMLSMI